MSQIDINSVLAQMRTMAAQAQASSFEPTAVTESGASDFKALMSQALDQVSDTQHNAGRLAQAFERGDKGIDIAEVMIALQKADVSFQAITQVRNRLVSAYQDIMNMPI
ncbi:MAG: flagellar hook-basal body complex protein FliE [Proteobacteria bacterium]|nr:MAG: flagellar hook-basal body complex protein FliE [Pseudomonadota bacterium]